MRTKTRSIIQIIRFIVQALFSGLASWLILSFWGVAGAHHLCPFAIIEVPILSLSNSVPPYFFTIGIIIGISFAVLSLIFPRVFCGWVCPVGFMERILAYPGKWLKISVKIPVEENHLLGWFPFIVLAYVAIGTFFTGSIFCMGGCPFFWGYALAGIPMPPLSIVLISIFLFGSIIVERFFCRWFCPYGAILGFIGRFSLFAIRKQNVQCEKCAVCLDCPMGTLPQKTDAVRGGMCICCLKCVGRCETGFLKITLRRRS